MLVAPGRRPSLARAGLAWLGELAAHRTSASVTSALRRQLLARAVALGPSWLAGERTGELTSAATQGVEALDVYFARYLPTAVLGASPRPCCSPGCCGPTGPRF